MSIGMIIFGIVLAIVMALLPSTMSDHMEEAVLFAAVTDWCTYHGVNRGHEH